MIKYIVCKEEIFMKNNSLAISEELVKNLSIEQLVDLKVELEELSDSIADSIDECNEMLSD